MEKPPFPKNKNKNKTTAKITDVCTTLDNEPKKSLIALLYTINKLLLSCFFKFIIQNIF